MSHTIINCARPRYRLRRGPGRTTQLDDGDDVRRIYGVGDEAARATSEIFGEARGDDGRGGGGQHRTGRGQTVELAEETDAEPNDSVFENNGHIVSTTYERIEVTEWSTPAGIADAPIDAVPLDEGDTEVLKVSAKSRPSAVAGAIAGVVRENGRAEVQAIGAGATNQAIKAIAIAREYLLETDIDAICVPAFIDVTIDNEERTAIRLVIERR